MKKLDDKQMLTETHLVESRIYHSLENVPKGESRVTTVCISSCGNTSSLEQPRPP